MNPVKYKTETQAFVGRCKELFRMFSKGEIVYKEMKQELDDMSSRQLKLFVIPSYLGYFGRTKK